MRIERTLRVLTVFCLLVVLPVAVAAETLYLKNGQVVTGTILGQTRTEVRIRTANGIRVFPKDQINRIAYTTAEQEAAARRAEEERRRRAEEARRQQEEEERRQQEEAEAEQRRQREEERRQREEQESQERETSYDLIGDIVRSAVLPGWGQYNQGVVTDGDYASSRKTTGIIYGVTFATLLASSFALDNAYARDRENYRNNADLFLLTSPLFLSSAGVTITDTSPYVLNGLLLIDQTSATRQTMEDSARYANAMRSVLLAFYVWNLVDVVLYHPTDDQYVGFGLDGDQASLRYAFSF